MNVAKEFFNRISPISSLIDQLSGMENTEDKYINDYLNSRSITIENPNQETPSKANLKSLDIRISELENVIKEMQSELEVLQEVTNVVEDSFDESTVDVNKVTELLEDIEKQFMEQDSEEERRKLLKNDFIDEKSNVQDINYLIVSNGIENYVRHIRSEAFVPADIERFELEEELTDHKDLWLSVDDILNKEEVEESSINFIEDFQPLKE